MTGTEIGWLFLEVWPARIAVVATNVCATRRSWQSSCWRHCKRSLMNSMRRPASTAPTRGRCFVPSLCYRSRYDRIVGWHIFPDLADRNLRSRLDHDWRGARKGNAGAGLPGLLIGIWGFELRLCAAVSMILDVAGVAIVGLLGALVAAARGVLAMSNASRRLRSVPHISALSSSSSCFFLFTSSPWRHSRHRPSCCRPHLNISDHIDTGQLSAGWPTSSRSTNT